MVKFHKHGTVYIPLGDQGYKTKYDWGRRNHQAAGTRSHHHCVYGIRQAIFTAGPMVGAGMGTLNGGTLSPHGVLAYAKGPNPTTYSRYLVGLSW